MRPSVALNARCTVCVFLASCTTGAMITSGVAFVLATVVAIVLVATYARPAAKAEFLARLGADHSGSARAHRCRTQQADPGQGGSPRPLPHSRAWVRSGAAPQATCPQRIGTGPPPRRCALCCPGEGSTPCRRAPLGTPGQHW